jgi:lipopolysaccharide transport system permease protein
MSTDKKTEKWDLVIEPQTSLFTLKLGDVWRYRDLLLLLVKRDFISFYKQTILGPLWFFLQPAMTTVIFTFVFGGLANISTDGLPGPLFYMTGLVAWNYFAECITKTSTVFKDNVNILGKVYFPRLIMPLSIVVSNLVKFGVQVLLLVIVFLYYKLFRQEISVQPNAYILLAPVVIIMMAALGLGLGMIISAMTTKYRDLAFLVTFGVQLLMYATTVIYPLSEATKKFNPFFAAIVRWNPTTHIIETLRYGILGSGTFSWSWFLYALGITTFILLAGVIVFNKVEKDFVDTV